RGVGGADGAVPAVRERRVEADGHRQGFALVGIAQQGRTPVDLGGPSAVLVAAAGVAHLAPVAAAAVAHQPGGRVVQAAGRVVGTQVGGLVVHAVLVLQVLRLDRAHQAPPGQLGVVAQAELPHRRELEVRVDGVDLVGRAGGTAAGDGLVV